MSHRLSRTLLQTTLVQGIVLLLFAASFGASRSGPAKLDPMATVAGASPAALTAVPVPRSRPLYITPLYNDPEVVSDDDLGRVLRQVRPRFPTLRLKPNFVEHSLRIWGVDAVFSEPGVLSGEDLKNYLVDHGKYLASWPGKSKPLLLDGEVGVAIRWGKEDGASVHHDHWLACLTEAGCGLDQQIHMPSKRIRNLGDAVQQALRDFRVDEREVEWSAMAFGLWIAPTSAWYTTDGRKVSFDLIAQRLMQGMLKFGVCHGTHRVYSLMLLVRLDDQFPETLSDEMREKVMAHLHMVKQCIIESQFEDGHWPSNWSEGAAAKQNPIDDPLYKKVIATGHHLEWLSIAPLELHPPRESVRKAARWAIDAATSRTPQQLFDHYTFYSHVGGALSNWRGVRPAEYYARWSAMNPIPEGSPLYGPLVIAEEKSTASGTKPAGTATGAATETGTETPTATKPRDVTQEDNTTN